MVTNGEFRLDLLQRLNAVTLHLPPLRERHEDIELYTTLFLQELTGDRPFPIKASGIDALLSHPWRGNTRELKNVIQNIVILSNKRELDGETVREALLNTSGFSKASPLNYHYQQIRTDILNALEVADGNRSKAAEALAMHRSTLLRWIKKLGIGNAIAGKQGRPFMLAEPEEELV